jgi:hypothetical protein
MAGRMQRDRYAIDVEAFAICCGLQIDSRQPRYEDPCTRLRGEVVRVTPARMVGMGMRDDRTVDGLPGIDIEIAGRALEPFRPGDDQI